jgi:hypothetical protein
MMSAFQQTFVLIQAPQTADDAQRLSVFISGQYGSKGWQVVAVVEAGGNLLLTMQKPLPIPD